jgi:16S rRNA (cytosine1402-N4)-methyltransferase
MSTVYHIPAMLHETISGLQIKPAGTYVDVTFGGGGHSRAIMKELTNDGGRLFSFDQDADALANAIDDPRWTFVHSNFRYLRNWLDYYGVTAIDGLLADLGVSFHHFDCPERGFSFRFPAPLDMRMNQTAKRTAADIVNTYSEEDLARIFYLYGELNSGRAIAKNLCRARSQKAILRTEDLVAASRIPAERSKELARLFQALRIEVNDELGALRDMLVAARDLLAPGGRIAILTYHSLEDRLVKNFLRSGNLEGTIEKDFYGNILTPFTLIEKGREASPEEVAANPRARSAKLRIAEKKS